MAYSLPGEPSTLDRRDLNRTRGAPVRARASILGYNEIIWAGRLARNGAVGDLDLDNADEEHDESKS